ncbi:Fic family protein [bacterium 210820-DFI.6.37]|nr:Fic family protein [bacterium 210820-DFI.6.37]
MRDDIYCYHNSDILKNKLDIRDKKMLLQAEIEYATIQLMDLQCHPIDGTFDFNHLCGIHKYIFQDLYDWAGEPRTVNIGKGNLFCLTQNIASYANFIFANYYSDCFGAKNDEKQFIHQLTNHYADLNALHPFREGNGRAQREFARELCLKCGYVLDLTQTTHEEMLNASIKSFHGDNRELAYIFRQHLKPI